MRAGFLYFKLQCKKYCKILPAILAESLLLVLFIGTIGVMTVRIMGQASSLTQIKVGVVSGEDENLTKLLLGFVEGMDSFKERCTFVRASEQEVYKALESGELYAAVILPEGIMAGILNGTNIPAKVILSRACSEMETAVFAEVAGAGGRMLSVAQAGIYAADDLCLEAGYSELITEAEAFLNETYLNYALKRATIFEVEEVSATGKVGLFSYYGVSLLLVFLTFAAVVAGRYAKIKVDVHGLLLSASGLRQMQQYLCDVYAFVVTFTVAGCMLGYPVLVLCARQEGTISKIDILCIIFTLVVMSLALFLRLLLQITGNNNTGMGCLLILLLMAMLICGLFLPTAFLPVWTDHIAQFLPFSLWTELLLTAMSGNLQVKPVVILIIGSLLTVPIGMLIFYVRNIRRGREAAKV